MYVGHFQMVLENEGTGEGASSSRFGIGNLSFIRFPDYCESHQRSWVRGHFAVGLLESTSNHFSLLRSRSARLPSAEKCCTSNVVQGKNQESHLTGHSHGTISRDNLTGQTKRCYLLLATNNSRSHETVTN